jgi:hypothetical protein
MKRSWIFSVLSSELSYIKKIVDNVCPVRYLRKNTPWMRMPTKDAIILDLEEDNLLYNKTKSN